MYKIGDKIVYPMHGAGVIEAIEEREILGEKKGYYIMKMPLGDLKLMIPISNIDEIGIRGLINDEDADQVIEELKEYTEDENSNWNKRYRENMEKIKTGDIIEVSHVVKTLMRREKEKGLSTGERKMLSNARQILTSELVLAKETTQDQIDSLIEHLVFS